MAHNSAPSNQNPSKLLASVGKWILRFTRTSKRPRQPTAYEEGDPPPDSGADCTAPVTKTACWQPQTEPQWGAGPKPCMQERPPSLGEQRPSLQQAVRAADVHMREVCPDAGPLPSQSQPRRSPDCPPLLPPHHWALREDSVWHVRWLGSGPSLGNHFVQALVTQLPLPHP